MTELEFLDAISRPLSSALTAFGDMDKAIVQRMNQLKTVEKALKPVGPIVRTQYRLSDKSVKELQGVHPQLIECVYLAIQLTTQDFMVYDGIRTEPEQRANIARGASQTMNSKHLVQPDGFGHAVDLVPYIGGIPKWDWNGCYQIAMAVDQAATKLGFAKNIRWGGAWDRTLDGFHGDVSQYKKAVSDYAARHQGKDFLDGPHFEWKP